MRSIPYEILQRIKSPAIDKPLVSLIDFALLGGAHLRYANYGSDVVYQAHTYTAWSFTAQILGATKRNGIWTTTVEFDDALQELTPHVIANDYFRGGVTLTAVLIAPDLPALDYSGLTATYDIKLAKPSYNAVTVQMGGPNLLRRRFEAGRFFAEVCDYDFPDDPRCGYVGQDVLGVTLSTPIEIEVDGDGFADDDQVTLAGIAGISPSLDAVYAVTRVSAGHFTLNTTAGSGYSGAYTAGGSAGYAICRRTLDDCDLRLGVDKTRFGGCLGARDDTVRLVQY